MFVSGQNAIYFRNVSGFGALLDEKPNSAAQEGAARFLQMAEDEGFTFGDGVKPIKRECGEIMAINQDNTINFVGHIGAIAFQAGAKKIGNEELIRIDFDKYVSGEKHFLFKKNRT